MTDTVTSAPAAPTPSKGFVGRIVGVLFSPRATFADIAARPRWLGVLALVVVVTAAGTFIFLSSEVGRTAALDQQIRTMESFGRRVTDAQYAQMERMLPVYSYVGALSNVVVVPVITLAIAAVAFALFSALLGGDATFAQVFSIVAHSGVIVALQTVFSLPLDYVRETLASPTSLAVFLPFLDENTFVMRMLQWVDLFRVWWIVTLAIGFAVLYRRRTAPIAATMLAVYIVIAIVAAAVGTALSGA
jgi:hypothetical protein